MAEMRILMAHVNDPNQRKIDTYEKNGGYQAIKKAIPKNPTSGFLPNR